MSLQSGGNPPKTLRVQRIKKPVVNLLSPPKTIYPPYADNWPPDYKSIYLWRASQIQKIIGNPMLLHAAKAYYRKNPTEFINHWVDTYDPRNAGATPPKPVKMPFVLFKRQEEFIKFIYQCLKEDQSGLIEKSRDCGATWLACAIAVHLYLFEPGIAVGFGSRKEELVDHKGNPDSIMEKIRLILRGLPAFFLPTKFKEEHMSFMRIVNPETGATIIGEVGDNIGRGSRKKVMIKDEAQPLDAKILTPTGWKTMADMWVGCHIIGADGKTHKVTQIKDFGVRDIYRITFSDGTFAECSPHHKWTVERKHGKSKIMTLPTYKLAENYLYKYPDGKIQYKYCIPFCSPVKFFMNDKLPLHPYLVGALLGDGSIKDVPKSCPRITSADQEVLEQFNQLLPIGVILRFEARFGYRIIDERDQHECNRWSKSRARQIVVDSGIAGHGAAEKFIPDAYKFSSPENRLALLQGLMDTDGSASEKSPSFYTTSTKLAEDVIFLVQSLGGRTTHNIKPDSRGYLDLHALSISLPIGMAPFRLSRKLNNLAKKNKALPRSIVSVALVDKRPVRCISVDAKDGLYLTDNCIVTHNSGHYEHAESIEAALSETTRVQIDISSVSGMGTVFHNKRESGVDWDPIKGIVKGKVNVFVFDWSDHPEKDQNWYNEKRAKFEAEGLLAIFAQEIERDYAAAAQGVIIPGVWLMSCIDAHKKLGFDDSGKYIAALDVADMTQSGDINAVAVRRGIVLKYLDNWGGQDTGQTTRKTIHFLRNFQPLECYYDCNGVGAGVKSEYNRVVREKVIPPGIAFKTWDAGAKVLDPDKHVIPHDKSSPLNKDHFQNFKAQAWLNFRWRVERTHRAVTDTRYKWHEEELLSFDSSTIPAHMMNKLRKELSQPTMVTSMAMKVMVDKQPEGMKSPNLAEAVVMCYSPRKTASFPKVTGYHLMRAKQFKR